MSQNSKETFAGLLFIGPMIVGIGIFILIPILGAVFLSFHDWNFMKGLQGFTFVGTKHFVKMWHDPVFIMSLKNNFIFILSVPATMLIAFLLAVILNDKVYGKGILRVVFFLPYISSMVAVAIVWQVLFHPSKGPVNQTLKAIGITDPPGWIADPQTALLSIIIMYVWIQIGFYMIIYLAGLQSIPKDLYEAADIDGAQTWNKYKSITIPMLSPTTFFLLVTGIIESFKVFDIISVVTEGGPAHSTSVLVYTIYDYSIVDLKYGYASAISLILLVCVLIITMVQWYGQRKWVNY